VVGNRKRRQRVCRGLELAVRRRRGGKRAVGTRAPILVAAAPNARWSLDFVHDQLADGRRLRVVDDATKRCLAAIVDTADWVEDHNAARPHPALGCLSPTAYVATCTATGARRSWSGLRSRAPVAPTAGNRQTHAAALLPAG
jgi:transposase InsO family protein